MTDLVFREYTGKFVAVAGTFLVTVSHAAGKLWRYSIYSPGSDIATLVSGYAEGMEGAVENARKALSKHYVV